MEGVRSCSPSYLKYSRDPENGTTTLTTRRCSAPNWRESTASSITFVIRAYSAKDGFSRYRVGETKKSLVRWRTTQNHHSVQQRGRDDILEKYHLRVGEIFADNRVPTGMHLLHQRSDETEVGEGTMVTIITPTSPAGHPD